MDKEYREMLSQVYVILQNMPDSDVNKIPIKLIEFIRENILPEYNFIIDVEIPLSEQNLKKDTLDFLALLSRNYWCETAEEKKMFDDILLDNEKKYQEELRIKYNPDNIFKK